MSIKQLWVESYRPKTLDGYVFSTANQKQQLESWVKDKSIPNLIFSGGPGTGKTTCAKILVNELGVNPYDFKQINASQDNGVDYIRDTVVGFASTMPFGTLKVILLDECLTEETLVTVLREGKIQQIPIRDLRDETDLVKSLEVETNNIVWRPFTLFNKGVADVIEIEFENGEKVICTPTHKWYIEDENGNVCVVNASELKDHIMTI
jgi:hypothetical protein